ncbi:MAG: DUF2207 domain-containing protein, partial [Mailhella sp.]
MKAWFAALAIFLFMAADVFAAPVHVKKFDSLVDIRNNGDIIVHETLAVEIPAEGTFHGIFREIPVVTRWKEQGRAEMEVLAVRVDGKNLPEDDIERTAGMVRVYQRDKKQTLSAGVHEFFLSYRMSGQIGLFENNDELTWNVTGSRWENPIDMASCTVLCPRGAAFFGQRSWIGKAGSKESPVRMKKSVKDGRVVMSFVSERAVLPGEDFTAAAGWQKGFITLERRASSVPGWILFAIFDALLFCYFFTVWLFAGKDPRKGVIIPLYRPPVMGKNMAANLAGKCISPAAAAFLFHKNRLTPECLGAAIMSLAGRGCCRISGNTKEGFSLRKGKGSSPYAEENRLLAYLAEEEMPVDSAHGETLYRMRQDMKQQLYEDYGKLWKGSGGLFGSLWMFAGMVAALIGLAAITGYVTNGVMPSGAPAAVIVLGFLFIMPRNMFRAVSSRRKAGKKAPVVVMLIMGLAMLAFCVFLLFEICRESLELFSAAEMALAAAAMVIPLGFSFVMDAPTKEARALLDAIEGLALY